MRWRQTDEEHRPMRKMGDVFDMSTMGGVERRVAFLSGKASGVLNLLKLMRATLGGTWIAEIVLRRVEDDHTVALQIRHDPKTGRYSVR